jgi:hypothetical protein
MEERGIEYNRTDGIICNQMEGLIEFKEKISVKRIEYPQSFGMLSF